MGKRAAASRQPPQISERPRTRRKKTPDDDAAEASGLGSSSATTNRTRTRIRQPKVTPDDAAPGLLSSCSATSQQADRPRQGKKRSPPAPRGLLSCATATATAQVRPLSALSWGTKRLRTGAAAAALPGSRWRDWAGLDEGPAALIAERVLADDVAGYVRFRAVCVPWRRCCADPRGVLEDPRFFPRHWIMLLDDYERLATDDAPHGIRRRFLNTRTGQCIQVDVPELRDHGVFRATAEGLLVMHCKQTEAVRLLNPLTRQMTQLPRTTGLEEEFSLECIGECTTCCAGLLDHSTVYLYLYSSAGTMAIAQPGDDRWVLLDAGIDLITATVCFAGRFYGFAPSTGVVTVDMTSRRMVVAAEPPKPFTFRTMLNDTVHLVDNGDGDLRLVHRMQRRVRVSGDHYTDKWMYKVYKVNFSTGKTTTRGRSNLGGRAIFVDQYCGFSVSPQVFPFLSADTIYLGLHCSERCVGNEQIGAYHVRDGSIQPPHNVDNKRHRLTHPLSIADSLIAYVSG